MLGMRGCQRDRRCGISEKHVPIVRTGRRPLFGGVALLFDDMVLLLQIASQQEGRTP
jgi:hypothetical protein